MVTKTLRIPVITSRYPRLAHSSGLGISMVLRTAAGVATTSPGVAVITGSFGSATAADSVVGMPHFVQKLSSPASGWWQWLQKAGCLAAGAGPATDCSFGTALTRRETT